MSDTGYVVGPTLEPGERPWPCGWERDPIVHDGHVHRWESVLLHDPKRPFWLPGRFYVEEVIRCEVCHAPRCGHSTERDPCMEARHHRAPHRYLSGRLEPVGGGA